jgi:uncharacterized protein (DUF2384 family)
MANAAGRVGQRTGAPKRGGGSLANLPPRRPAEAMKPKSRSPASTAQPETGRGSGLVAAFRDSKGVVAVGRVAERFGLSKAQLAQTIGVGRKAIYRTTRLQAPKTQARTTEMLEILGRIVDWAGGEMQAMAWYRAEPIAAFGGRTAESLVKSGMAAAVRDYLDHVATGGFA